MQSQQSLRPMKAHPYQRNVVCNHIPFPVALFSSHVHLLRITFTSSMFRFFVVACSQKLRRKMESVLSSPKYEFAGAPNDNFWKISVWKTI